jgi:3-oxoadipate enol-lactonase/4-carboxymuconolactone decarboxylase
MPLVNAGGLRHYYRLEGADNLPELMCSHSLGCDHTQWDPQAAALAPHFRVLRYDTRGHGATDVPPGDYSIEILARDALAIADALGIRVFAFCGLSLGGMIAQWLAAHAADRVTAVVLANTSPRMADPGAMETRRRTVLEHGMSAVEDAVLGRFFSADRLAANPPEVANTRRVLLATDLAGYAGCCAAVRDLDQVALLRTIRMPALIIAGDHDASTPWNGHGGVIAREVVHARVELLPTAHLSNLERPHSFTAALLQFLLPPPRDSLSAGLKQRRDIMGDAWVDRGPSLDTRTRSLLALSVTAALGRWEEFRLQLRSGLQHGLEPCDIQEMLLQLGIDAGVPSANTGFQIAAEEVAKT